jgi:hypothetical protein
VNVKTELNSAPFFWLNADTRKPSQEIKLLAPRLDFNAELALCASCILRARGKEFLRA